MNQAEALDLVRRYHVRIDRDFHALGTAEVANVINAANAWGYRKPRNANGSRGRYFHAYLRRAAGPLVLYRSAYFAQGEEAAPDLDAIDRDGAAAWLSELSGAIDLFSLDSEASPVPPWGRDDVQEYVQTTESGRVFIHRHRGGLYVSVTTETTQ